jgi:hypothetical protein
VAYAVDDGGTHAQRVGARVTADRLIRRQPLRVGQAALDRRAEADDRHREQHDHQGEYRDGVLA